MTERQWLESTNPLPMLEFLRESGKSSERKLRLFAVASSRRIWKEIDDLGRAAVAVAEQFADGLVGPELLRSARLACKSAGGNSSWYAAVSDASIAARNAALSAQAARDSVEEQSTQAALVRDIFGNPFHEAALDPRCRTASAISLANAIYDEMPSQTGYDRRLPILANVLAKAGCADVGILNHLQNDEPHVRGCWVVDWILGRE